jgi:hypothetical protein
MLTKIKDTDFKDELKKRYFSATELPFKIGENDYVMKFSPESKNKVISTTREVNYDKIKNDFTDLKFKTQYQVIKDSFGRVIAKGIGYVTEIVNELDMKKVEESPEFLSQIEEYTKEITEEFEKTTSARITFK